MTAGNKLTGGTAFVGDLKMGTNSAGDERFVPRTVKVALTASTGTTGGEVLAWANPENTDILVTSVVLDVTTEATGAANIDVGAVNTANAAPHADHSSDTVIDGGDVGSAAIILNNTEDQGTNGQTVVKLNAADNAAPGYISATGSASTAGLVGSAYITYITA